MPLGRLQRLARAAKAEKKRRAATAGVAAIAEAAKITAEQLSGGHHKQLAMIRDAALYMIVLCSRRAGKTYGLACLALLTALARPRQNILYIGLSKPHARKFLWNEVWCPLLDALDPEKKWHKRVEDEMTTTFANGSIMYVSGTDDVRHIESFLGNRLNLAIVDEAQSQADSVLIPLTTRILPNALLDDMDNPGKLVMSGTIPEVDAGRFIEVWKEGKWSRHNWNRFENPHLKNQNAALDAYLFANPGLKAESPEVQREWFGQFKFDPTATAYRYIEEINSYRHQQAPWLVEILNPSGPESDIAARTRKLLEGGNALAAMPWRGIEVFGVGLDVGGVDRMAAEVNGWGAEHPHVQHLFDWASARNAGLSWDDLGLVCKVIAEHYQTGFWFYDSNSKTTLDTFNRLYGVPVIQAANKSDFDGQLKLFNTLLTSGKFKAMIGSQLVEDLRKSRLDPDKLKKQQYAWASSWHPDPSEAARYSLRPYFDAYTPPDTRTEEEKQRAAWVQPLEDVLTPPPDDGGVDDRDLVELM